MITHRYIELQVFQQGERHIPTAEADAGAGKVLVREEGVTGHVLIWNVSTEPLAQGLMKESMSSDESTILGRHNFKAIIFHNY